MLELRIRACHVHGRFIAKDNKPPPFTLKEALENPVRDANRIVLPPAIFPARAGEDREALAGRGRVHQGAQAQRDASPATRRASASSSRAACTTRSIRALELLGLADAYGNTRVPLYVLNVTYPLIDDEVAAFCAGKKAVLMVEEGQPDYHRAGDLNTILRRARHRRPRCIGKDVLPMAGEYTAAGDAQGRRRRSSTRYAPRPAGQRAARRRTRAAGPRPIRA